jgi:anti-sigma factor RsiW
MGLFSRTDDHQWSQQHLSHYVEGDLGRRARRRLDRHAEDCADCGRGIRAMRALLRLIPGIEGREAIRAPAGIFDKVRSSGTQGTDDDGAPAPPPDA